MSDFPPSEDRPAPAAPARRLAQKLLVLALVLGCFGCDQVAKKVAEASLPLGRRISLLGDTVRLERVKNPGAFLGMGARLDPKTRRALFTWGVGVLVLAALAYAFHPRTDRTPAVGAALVAGGGLGNLWDRIAADGWVTDYLNLGIGPVRTGIFNVADVAIVAGVLVLMLRPGKRRDEPPAPAGEG